jgi:CRISPR system Cascade subunit CasC
MKTLVEIHVLQNFAPSNLNRDDTGAPKDAFFGGFRRARISSQCLKHNVREYFKGKNDKYFANRTKRLVDELKTQLQPKLKDVQDITDENLLKAIEAAINCIGAGDKKVKVEKDKKTGQLKTDVLLFLSKDEINDFAEAIQNSFSDLIKGKVPSEIVEKVRGTIDGKENKSRLSLDIALFGRMLAVMPEKNQNAACQVAHAISTHVVEREFDFFTAIDDLKPEETTGSDMMGDVEFTSACFYRYAVVDYDKLVENLNGNADFTTEGIRAFLEGFVISEPTGKQNSTAPHNPPEFVLISVRHDTAPRNLSNAFETPVRATKEESFTKKSAIKLAEKATALDTLYKTQPNSRYACSKDTFDDDFKVEGLCEKMPSIPDLIDWAIKELEKKGE